MGGHSLGERERRVYQSKIILFLKPSLLKKRKIRLGGKSDLDSVESGRVSLATIAKQHPLLCPSLAL